MIIRQPSADFFVSPPKVKKKRSVRVKNTGYFDGYIG